MVRSILESSYIKETLPQQVGHNYRLMLLNKDRTVISDVISLEGHVPGKGELTNVLDREKNSVLLVEQYEEVEEQNEEFVNVLLHHCTKTSEKIGHPLCLLLPRSYELGKLKMTILEKAYTEEMEFEGRMHKVNPMKLWIYAYTKDISKSIELPDPHELLPPPEDDAAFESKSNEPLSYEDNGKANGE